MEGSLEVIGDRIAKRTAALNPGGQAASTREKEATGSNHHHNLAGYRPEGAAMKTFSDSSGGVNVQGLELVIRRDTLHDLEIDELHTK